MSPWVRPRWSIYCVLDFPCSIWPLLLCSYEILCAECPFPSFKPMQELCFQCSGNPPFSMKPALSVKAMGTAPHGSLHVLTAWRNYFGICCLLPHVATELFYWFACFCRGTTRGHRGCDEVEGTEGSVRASALSPQLTHDQLHDPEPNVVSLLLILPSLVCFVFELP